MPPGGSTPAEARLSLTARCWSLIWACAGFAVAGSAANTLFVAWPLERASASWPTADGTVIDARIDSVRNSRGSMQYHLAVTYRYRVGDSTRVSSALRHRAAWYSTYPEAAQAGRRYGIGAPVPVHYDPERADVSVLEPTSMTWVDWMILPAGILMLGVGLYCGWEVISGRPGRPLWGTPSGAV